MPLFKVIARLFATCVILYALGIVVFYSARYVWLGNDNHQLIDSYAVRSDKCRDDIGVAIDELHLLKPKEKPKLIFLGASNTRDGFRPKDFGTLLPEYEVHNLSVSAGNVTQARETVEFLIDENPDAVKGATFIFGASAGSMFSNKGRGWGESGTPFSQLVQEYHQRESSDDLTAEFPIVREGADFLAEPMACAAKVGLLLTANKEEKLAGFGRKLRIYPKLTQQDKIDELRHRFGLIVAKTPEGPYKEQIEEIGRLNDVVQSIDGRLVIAILPTAPWYHQSLPFENDLAMAMKSVSQRFGVPVVTLAGKFTDEMFKDQGHPVQKVTPIWAESLSNEIKRIDDRKK